MAFERITAAAGMRSLPQVEFYISQPLLIAQHIHVNDYESATDPERTREATTSNGSEILEQMTSTCRLEKMRENRMQTNTQCSTGSVVCYPIEIANFFNTD